MNTFSPSEELWVATGHFEMRSDGKDSLRKNVSFFSSSRTLLVFTSIFQVWVCHRGPRKDLKKRDVKSFVLSHKQIYLNLMGPPTLGLSNDGIPIRWESIPALFDMIELQKGKFMYFLL